MKVALTFLKHLFLLVLCGASVIGGVCGVVVLLHSLITSFGTAIIVPLFFGIITLIICICIAWELTKDELELW